MSLFPANESERPGSLSLPGLTAILVFITLAFTGCAQSARIVSAGAREASDDPNRACSILPAGSICSGDPIGLKICPNGLEQLVWADGRTAPLPTDYFGGWRIVRSEADIPSCPDGARPRQQDMTPYKAGEPTG